MLNSIRYENGRLHLLDQRKLPHEEKWLEATRLEEIAQAIECMCVRGAPAIAIAATYALAVDAMSSNADSWRSYRKEFDNNCLRLLKTRPTAVNLNKAIKAIAEESNQWALDLDRSQFQSLILNFARKCDQHDLETCRAIGRHGLKLSTKNALKIMTHCNTGTLATAGFGTALGVIRSLFHDGRIAHVYVNETRPYLQGSRLTAFELQSENIPYSIHTDSAAAYVMHQEKVDFVIVGADRITNCGDTANKIGTYGLAILARHHNIPFYVAAPATTFDWTIRDGNSIPIEMRPAEEVTQFGGVAISPKNSKVINPGFDITPAHLINAFVTESGLLTPPFDESIFEFAKS